MLTKVRRRLEQEEGFTLIELLVVILIIGILAAVAIPTFLAQKNKAGDSNAQSNLKSAQTISEAYANGNGGSYASGTGAVLSSAISNNDANTLSQGTNAVDYISSGGSTDTYCVFAQGSSGRYWYINVVSGATYYGVETSVPTSCPATSASNMSGATPTTASTSGFPSFSS